MTRLKILNVEVCVKWKNKKWENGESEPEVKLISKTETTDKADQPFSNSVQSKTLVSQPIQ